MRRYSKMTKEMTPSHRIDALCHYAERSATNLGTCSLHDMQALLMMHADSVRCACELHPCRWSSS